MATSAWSDRLGLNILPESNGSNTVANEEDFEQNIRARIAWSYFDASVLDAPGVFAGGAVDLTDFNSSANKYPPITMAILDSSNNPWWFDCDVFKQIYFSSASIAAATLYAVVLTENGLVPAAAIGGRNDFYLIAQATADAAPSNSLKLGTGVVASSAFTSFSYFSTNFKTVFSKYFTLSADSGADQEISNGETVSFSSGDGVKLTTGPSTSLNLAIDLANNSGLEFFDNQLQIKTKSGGIVRANLDGIFLSSPSSFILEDSYGNNSNISLGLNISIGGIAPFSTAIEDTDVISIYLNLDADGGLIQGEDWIRIKIVDDGYLILKDDGLARDEVNLTLSGNSGTSQSMEEDDEITLIYNSGAPSILTRTKTGEEIEFYLKYNPEHFEEVSDEFQVNIKENGGILCSTDGLYLDVTQDLTLQSYYGAPTTGTFQEKHLIRDALGSLFKCVVGGTPGEWMQVEVASSETIPYLYQVNDDYRIKYLASSIFSNSSSHPTIDFMIWFKDDAKNRWVSEHQFHFHEYIFSTNEYGIVVDDFLFYGPDKFIDFSEVKIKQISSHQAATSIGLDRYGRLFSWGSASNGGLADQTITNKSLPVLAVGSHSFVQVVRYEGLKLDGTAWTWGGNSSGELGDGTTTNKSSPVSVIGNHSFIAIHTSDGRGGRKEDGSVWLWGVNTYGELGDQTTTSKSSPVSVVGGHSFIQSEGGTRFNLGLKSDGTVWAWGRNQLGQLGDQTAASKSSPISVVGGHSFTSIACGSIRILALKADGTAWAWGDNSSGGIGDQTTAAKSSPVSVVGGHSFTHLSVGDDFSLGLKSDGSVWSWGENGSGQLGDETTADKSSPVSVVGDHSFLSVSAGSSHVEALKEDGTVWAWGENGSGQLGDETTVDKSSPIQVVLKSDLVDEIHVHIGRWILPMKFRTITGTEESTYSLDENFKIWAWGDNSFGQLGIQQKSGKSSPVSIVGNVSYSQVSSFGDFAVALDTDGIIWSWGRNANGQFGNNTKDDSSSPVSVVGGHSFTSISAGDLRAYGLKADGTTWAWGSNANGALGDQTTVSRSSPVSVVGSHSFSSISAGFGTILTLKSDGTAWGWGDNSTGELGDQTTAAKSSPVSVVGDHSFVEISMGYSHILARKNDGTAWGWGSNSSGGLGDQTTAAKSSPISIVGDHSFISLISGQVFSLGLKENGTAWAWGENGSGQLGDETTADKSSPISVVGDHSFISIGVGYDTSFGVKTDGTVWAWGNNASGQIGDGTKVSKSSPVQVIKV